MNVKIFFVLIISFLMTACAGPRYGGVAIPDEVKNKKIDVVIIRDKETREGFGKAIESWLRKNNYRYTVQPDGSRHDLKKITIEYVGHWKWDLALYLSEARIEAFNQGQRIGEATYKAPNTLNNNKFSNAEERIEFMMRVLFGQISPEEATRSI